MYHSLTLIYGLHKGPYLAVVACCTYLCFGQPLEDITDLPLLPWFGVLDNMVLFSCSPNIDWVLTIIDIP